MIYNQIVTWTAFAILAMFFVLFIFSMGIFFAFLSTTFGLQPPSNRPMQYHPVHEPLLLLSSKKTCFVKDNEEEGHIRR